MKSFLAIRILVIAAAMLIAAGAGCSWQFQQPDRSNLPLAQCLPAGVKLTDQVGMKNTIGANGLVAESTPITLQDKLSELNAVCSSDKTLADAAGKRISLYSDTACWQGAAPSNSEELLTKQSNEVKVLEQSSIVIEIPCNGFVPVPP